MHFRPLSEKFAKKLPLSRDSRATDNRHKHRARLPSTLLPNYMTNILP